MAPADLSGLSTVTAGWLFLSARDASLRHVSEWALLLATSRCGTRASKRPVAAASQLHNTVAQDRIVTQSLYAVALDRIDNMQKSFITRGLASSLPIVIQQGLWVPAWQDSP